MVLTDLQITRFFIGLYYGIRKNFTLFVSSMLTAIGVIWTLVEASVFFLNLARPEGWKYICAILLVAIIYGFSQARFFLSTELNIPGVKTKLRLAFSDVLLQEGVVVIPVNEFFDSEFNGVVSETSLHGILIKRVLKNDSNYFDKEVAGSISSDLFEQVNRVAIKKEKYKIGTTAVVKHGRTTFLLVALSRTDPKTHKASAGLTELWTALNSVMERARGLSNGSPVNLPLIGGGLSNVGVTHWTLLDIITIAIMSETKKQEIAEHINIFIDWGRFNEIDLRHYSSTWRKRWRIGTEHM